MASTARNSNSPHTTRRGVRGRRETASRTKASTNPVESIREAFGFTRSDFRRLTGFSERGLADWEAGHRQPAEPAKRRLAELQRLQRALAKVVRQDAIGPWMLTPNKAFDGLKPLEVIERGELDRLWRMIFLLESGIAA